MQGDLSLTFFWPVSPRKGSQKGFSCQSLADQEIQITLELLIQWVVIEKSISQIWRIVSECPLGKLVLFKNALAEIVFSQFFFAPSISPRSWQSNFHPVTSISFKYFSVVGTWLNLQTDSDAGTQFCLLLKSTDISFLREISGCMKESCFACLTIHCQVQMLKVLQVFFLKKNCLWTYIYLCIYFCFKP